MTCNKVEETGETEIDTVRKGKNEKKLCHISMTSKCQCHVDRCWVQG